MKKTCVLLLCVVLCIVSIDCYKILGIFPSLERNNHLTYRELFRELANANHDVTVVGHFALTNPPENYKEILLSDEFIFKVLSYDSVTVNEMNRVPFETLISARNGHEECKILMKNHNVLHMIRSRARYDVIVAESFNSDCGLALAANLSAPYIAFNPEVVQPWQHNRLGINFNPSAVPLSLLPYGKRPWLFDRLKSGLLNQVGNWLYYVCSQVTDRVLLYNYLGDDLPPLESIAANASLVFVNSHPSVFGGTPMADNVIHIGGIHVKAPKVIPTAIDRFLSEAEHGAIYVNLGSAMQDSSLPEPQLRSLLDTFRKLPLRILWKWDGPEFEDLPKNVLTMRWFPHYDVLKHPNIRAVVGHASIRSSIEAIDAGVPVIAVPLFGSQYGIAAALSDAGVGVVIQYEELSEDRLMTAINDVLDPKVQQQAKQMARVWLDRPMSPMETAIYWIEYVARYNGAPNLLPATVGLPYFQTLQWEMILVVGFLVTILGHLIKLLSFLCCCICMDENPQQAAAVSTKRAKGVKFD